VRSLCDISWVALSSFDPDRKFLNVWLDGLLGLSSAVSPSAPETVSSTVTPGSGPPPAAASQAAQGRPAAATQTDRPAEGAQTQTQTRPTQGAGAGAGTAGVPPGPPRYKHAEL
jgi:hypothetical protein